MRSGWEVPLIDAEAVTQIESLREEIQDLPGSSSTRRIGIRSAPIAFRTDRCGRCETAEVAAVLDRAGCDRLTLVESSADTYIVQKGAGKGQALASVQAYLGCSGEPVAAIGDSAPDVDMLRAADIAYAPANASREVRELIARGECRRTSRPLQAGLLEAAMELCLAAGHSPDDRRLRMTRSRLRCWMNCCSVPDRHPVERILSALRWRGL
jgi:hydroxymethylpyrimidine pyrophosphatase-like HAD family hydrolase